MKTMRGCALVILLLCGCPKTPSGPDPVNEGEASAGAKGVWRASGAHTHEAMACAQRWSCDCKAVTAKPGCRITATADQSTKGACASDEGPHTACTRCMALEPEAACACPESCP